MDEVTILRTYAPSLEPAGPAEVAAARTLLCGHIELKTQPRRLLHPPRPSLRRSVALAFGALMLAGVVSVAGAAIFLEWGPVDHPATAAQIETEISSTMAVTPLPAGQNYPVDAIRARAEPAGNVTVFAGVQQVQFFAMCAWSGAWLDADQKGDEAAVRQATKVIGTFPTWQSVSDIRLADKSVRTQIKAVVVAAQAGQRGPIEGLFEAMACSSIMAH